MTCAYRQCSNTVPKPRHKYCCAACGVKERQALRLENPAYKIQSLAKLDAWARENPDKLLAKRRRQQFERKYKRYFGEDYAPPIH